MSETGEAAIEARKARASAWFTALQSEICAAFEALEDAQTAPPAGAERLDPAFADKPAGRFERKETRRAGEAGEDAGGGVMAVMRGRVFEKVGVNVSTVYGKLSAQAQKALTARKSIPGLADDPRFWASGVSLVAHMWNPRAPAVHMNTRHFWTPGAAWFGGGSDLNPTIAREDAVVGEDEAFFHDVLKLACDRHDAAYYPKFKAWADEYFMIRHWNEPRGVGGVFYDDLDTGDWEKDFAFTQEVGSAFLRAFMPIAERRIGEAFSEAERAHQLFRRGRYAEFNLVYDRGTQFGLATGHNPEAVLMSLPPKAAWP